MPTSIPIYIFQGIPEGIALTALVMSLGCMELRWKTICIIAVIQTAIVGVLRVFSAPGVHVIWAVIVLNLGMIFIGKMEMRKSSLWTAVGMTILIFLEMTTRFVIYKFGILTFDQINTSNFYRTLIALPQILIMFILAFIIHKINPPPNRNIIPWPKPEPLPKEE